MINCYTLNDMVKKCTIIKKNLTVCLFGFKKEKKQDSFKHHVDIVPPPNLLLRCICLLIAKDCMVDEGLHEFCLSNCGSTITRLHHLKKETLAFICTKASCKALFRSLSWNESSAGFLKKHLSADLITQVALGLRVIFRLGSECEQGHKRLVSQTLSLF